MFTNNQKRKFHIDGKTWHYCLSRDLNTTYIIDPNKKKLSVPTEKIVYLDRKTFEIAKIRSGAVKTIKEIFKIALEKSLAFQPDEIPAKAYHEEYWDDGITPLQITPGDVKRYVEQSLLTHSSLEQMAMTTKMKAQ
jgi:hypothetical protein